MWPHFFLWSEQVLEAATSPETFVRRLSEYVRNGLVSVASEEDVTREGQAQQYYTRLLDISPDQYVRNGGTRTRRCQHSMPTTV